MKKLLLGLILMISLKAQSIEGFWKTIDDKTGKARCIVAIYPYKKNYYGRIIGSFNEAGKLNDTIYNPISRATALPGEPFYSGLDFIWALLPHSDIYKGQILDPEHNDVYKAEVWVDDKGELVVRGKLMMFGRNQIWLPAQKSDFPRDFKMPDMKEFIPVPPSDELRIYD